MTNQVQTRFLNRLKSKDNIVLLICLLSSALIWMTIKLASERTYEVDIQTQYKVTPSAVVLSDLPKTLRVSLQGEIGNIMRFQSSLKKAKFELEIEDDQALSQTNVNNSLTKRLGKYDLTLVRNHTNSIPLEIDSIASKVVPIINQAKAFPLDGYLISSNKLVPDHIELTGPASFIFYVDSVSTNKLIRKDIKGSYTDSIDLLKSVSELIKFESNKVKWTVESSPLIPYEVNISIADFGSSTSLADSIQIYCFSIQDKLVGSEDFKLTITQNEAGEDIVNLSSIDESIIIDKYYLKSN